jgi:hypothetical protein
MLLVTQALISARRSLTSLTSNATGSKPPDPLQHAGVFLVRGILAGGDEVGVGVRAANLVR